MTRDSRENSVDRISFWRRPKGGICMQDCIAVRILALTLLSGRMNMLGCCFVAQSVHCVHGAYVVFYHYAAAIVIVSSSPFSLVSSSVPSIYASVIAGSATQSVGLFAKFN
ncbi:hypothetical protein ACMD2_15844 [Ananas comosus]|uniref:Uncharacterized protein n=1 Tax=Ananas comosus TaxID=4615 RepID=A0A199UEI5_ANACO|nr:hypothetical protein ACMD2_15844 [Ananas comosus]